MNIPKEKELLSFWKKYDMLPREAFVLTAVSGGADSMCLLHILFSLSKDMGFTLGALHYNHNLRGEESDGDEAFVKEYCGKLGIPLYTGSGDVSEAAKSLGIGTEDAARRMRYEFFFKTSQELGAGRIATAHTADDLGETILMNLTRGAGLSGLSGIPPVRGIIVRPILPLSRKDVETYLEKNAIPHREDSSNATDDYTRNRIRHRVIPVLKDINPGFADSAFFASELLRQDEAFLSSLADDFLKNNTENGELSVDALKTQPFPVASRVIRKFIGDNLSQEHVSAVLKLCEKSEGSGSVSIPGKTLCREYSKLVIRENTKITFTPFSIAPGDSIVIEALNMGFRCENAVFDSFFNKSLTSFLFKTDAVCGNIIIRPRKTADAIKLSHKSGTKTLKKLFIEKKIPARLRENIPVIADDKGPLAVLGIGCDCRTFARPGDEVIKVIAEEL